MALKPSLSLIVVAVYFFIVFPALALPSESEKYLTYSQSGTSLVEQIGPPQPISVPLNNDGLITLPSFIGLTTRLEDEGGEFFIVAQNPAPETEFFGLQHVVVYLELAAENGSRDEGFIILKLVDITPPEVTIELKADKPAQQAPAGHRYFVAPVTISPKTHVGGDVMMQRDNGMDEFDYDEECIMDDFGRGHGAHGPDKPGAIQSLGFHQLNTRIQDDSGNETVATEIIEIRNRPYGRLSLELHDYACQEELDGSKTLRGRLTLRGGVSGETRVSMQSLRLAFYDQESQSVAIWNPEDPETNATSLAGDIILEGSDEECIPDIGYALPLGPDEKMECPEQLAVLGRGHQNGNEVDYDETIDLGAFQDAETTSIFGGPRILMTRDEGCVEDDGVGPCEWKFRSLVKAPLRDWDQTSDFFCPANHAEAEVWAQATVVNGAGRAFAASAFNPLNQCFQSFNMQAVATKTNTGTKVEVWLDGPRCAEECECRIDVEGGATLKLSGRADNDGKAIVAGATLIDSECEDAQAIGGIAVNAESSGGIQTVGGYVIPYETHDSRIDRREFVDTLNCDVSDCEADAIFTTMGYINVQALSDPYPGVGYAFQSAAGGGIRESGAWISFVPDVRGDCQADFDRIPIGFHHWCEDDRE